MYTGDNIDKMPSSPTDFYSKGKGDRGDDEFSGTAFHNEFDIIAKQSLDRFVRKIDEGAQLDDQAANLVSKMADVFVKDVTMRVVKLAKYRKDEPSLLDVEFTLKREYNLRFPEPYS